MDTCTYEKTINSLVLSFLTVQLSHPYMTTGKTIALTRQTFGGKVMSLLFNMLSRLVIFRKHLTGGFLCTVLDLSGNVWPLLIPEYSGIKKRGCLSRGWGIQAFPLLVSHYSDKYPFLSLIGIALCFVNLEF